MIKYATVGSNDLDSARAFYDALLPTIGMEPFYVTKKGGCFYGHHHTGMFAVLAPYDGGPATIGNGTMIGIYLPKAKDVQIFHEKALELGATNEGDPGPRGGGEHAAYFAYFRDLDGNKLCAYTFPVEV